VPGVDFLHRSGAVWQINGIGRMVIDTKTVGITFGSLRMGQITSPEIDAFLTELRRQDLAASTIASYKGDLGEVSHGNPAEVEGYYVRSRVFPYLTRE
jgi:hypothetical protein